MKIPHDPVALEEHFRDDNEGPLSNEGYMPYLNRFILDKVGANDNNNHNTVVQQPLFFPI